MVYPTPRGDKLQALLGNTKLPAGDRPRVEAAIRRYETWIARMEQTEIGADRLVETLVADLQQYKTALEIDLIFDSEHDFLHRQKGQLKLDNTVLEEFLPRLVGRVFAGQLEERGLILGPVTAFAQMRFDSDLLTPRAGGGMVLRSKDQDFAVARPLYLKASHSPDFAAARQATTHLAYVAVEIKTNLDKTMFQEASATAYDLKLAVPSSRYFLLCEWLDMVPISTAVTAIEEVIVLRKAKRLGAQTRAGFATAAGRSRGRDQYTRHLAAHPLAPEPFRRFLDHMQRMWEVAENGNTALERGWF